VLKKICRHNLPNWDLQVKNNDQITIYETEDGKVQIGVLFFDENLWLTQKQMAQLFECSKGNISLHLKNVYTERELTEKATTEDFSTVQQEGNRKITRRVKHYSPKKIFIVKLEKNPWISVIYNDGKET